MIEVEEFCSKIETIEEIMEIVRRQRVTLQKDVERYCEERGV